VRSCADGWRARVAATRAAAAARRTPD
jgi:hypothetical protein